MTKEEAILELENGEWWDLIGEVSCDAGASKKFHAALDMAIAALRAQQEPLDRSRWEGCNCCQDIKRDDPEKFYITGTPKGRLVRAYFYFCPFCGRPLTEEAWAELEKKTCNVLPDHIRELLLAEREGRLIVMPFKLGDIVYRVVTTSKYLSRPKNAIYVKRIKIKPENVHKYVDEIGKSVFLTRDEAETELERRIGGNDGIN